MKIQKNFQRIETDGNNLYTAYYHFDEYRPVIIFLHDSLGCVQLWRDFPEKLAKATQCNALVYDRLGYGKSDPMPTYESQPTIWNRKPAS